MNTEEPSAIPLCRLTYTERLSFRVCAQLGTSQHINTVNYLWIFSLKPVMKCLASHTTCMLMAHRGRGLHAKNVRRRGELFQQHHYRSEYYQHTAACYFCCGLSQEVHVLTTFPENKPGKGSLHKGIEGILFLCKEMILNYSPVYYKETLSLNQYNNIMIHSQ